MSKHSVTITVGARPAGPRASRRLRVAAIAVLITAVVLAAIYWLAASATRHRVAGPASSWAAGQMYTGRSIHGDMTQPIVLTQSGPLWAVTGTTWLVG